MRCDHPERAKLLAKTMKGRAIEHGRRCWLEYFIFQRLDRLRHHIAAIGGVGGGGRGKQQRKQQEQADEQA